MTSTELPPASAPARRRGRPTEPAGGGDVNIWFFVKLALIALVDALGVYILWQAFVVESWWILVATAVALVGINWVYFARRAVPAKYLVPGLLFLLVYQVFTIVYTGYVSFTNYGQGHNDDKQAAIEEILEQNEFTLPDSVTYAGRVVERGEGEEAELGLAIVDDAGEVRVGFPEEPAESGRGRHARRERPGGGGPRRAGRPAERAVRDVRGGHRDPRAVLRGPERRLPAHPRRPQRHRGHPAPRARRGRRHDDEPRDRRRLHAQRHRQLRVRRSATCSPRAGTSSSGRTTTSTGSPTRATPARCSRCWCGRSSSRSSRWRRRSSSAFSSPSCSTTRACGGRRSTGRCSSSRTRSPGSSRRCCGPGCSTSASGSSTTCCCSGPRSRG